MRLLIALLFSLVPLSGLAAEKVALVVGMGDYQTVVKLDNTVNDARGIAKVLGNVGFQVTTLINATEDQFRSAVDDFAFRAETADIALIYYAGHGVEADGQNYLIPVDANVRSNKDIQRQAMSLEELRAAVEHARKMRVVILDACRNNPFGDSLDKAILKQTQEATAQTRSLGATGLAPPTPEVGTLIAFAAKDGEVALDGNGADSPFATALMQNLPKKGLEIGLMFREVRDDVLKMTGNQQEPYTYGSLSGTPFYIAGASDGTKQVDSSNPAVAWPDIRPDQETQMVQLAEKGDTRSMVGLAYMRLNADDSRYAPSDAAKLLATAAAAGSAEAQYELGQLYEKGLGVPQDPAKALELYQQAGKADFPDALNDLGFLYYQGGLGLARDPKAAIAFFKRAADLRQPQAMFNYAAMIDDGRIPGAGPKEAANYLYDSLRTGSENVYNVLKDKPNIFKVETRKALQARMAEVKLYNGPLNGKFDATTQKALAATYGLTN